MTKQQEMAQQLRDNPSEQWAVDTDVQRDLCEMKVINLCRTHHVELHANRRNYEALYGFTEIELMEETFAEHGEKVAA